MVMEHLVPNYLKGLIYGILVESFCSEQNARMTAMESATNSAKDMLKNLELQYNRARQASITQEITEVVSGARSLK
jgi:F-type H+-transporting ATPase subunit gamma